MPVREAKGSRSCMGVGAVAVSASLGVGGFGPVQVESVRSGSRTAAMLQLRRRM